MGDFVKISSTEEFLCTFALSGDGMVNQAIYVCDTCIQDGFIGPNTCCCSGCAEICHKDHEVSFLAFGRGYCDCGASNTCQLIQQTIPIANKVLYHSTSRKLSQDKDGRLEGTIESSLRIDPFTVHSLFDLNLDFENALKKEAAIEDVKKTVPIQETMIHVKSASIELAKYSKDTFWIGCQESPICIFEELALSIFHYHCRQLLSSSSSSCTYDPTCSGVEWWVQVKYEDHNSLNDSMTSTTSDSSSSHVLNTESTIPINRGIDLHFDKDEEIASAFGIGIFPQISTVTYLSSHPYEIPTIVIQDTVNDEIGSPLKQVFLSIPVFGKHIAFDGRYLHGAPIQLKPRISELASSSDVTNSIIQTKPRVTFLVNIWLNHHPAGISRISSEILQNLSSITSTTEFSITNPSLQLLQSLQPLSPELSMKTIQVNTSDVKEEKGLGEWLQIPFVSDKSVWGKDEQETGVYLKIWLPNQLLDGSYQSNLFHSPSCLTWNIHYVKGCSASLEYETDEEYIDEMEEGMNIHSNR